jgi:hypothetical protein
VIALLAHSVDRRWLAKQPVLSISLSNLLDLKLAGRKVNNKNRQTSQGTIGYLIENMRMKTFEWKRENILKELWVWDNWPEFICLLFC